MLASKPPTSEDLVADERWQLVQRIVASPAFQKSTRLRELLEYICERTLHGHAHELSEQHIGDTLFQKPSGYSSLEDSSVRVLARQLRLKLHEYYDEEGRSESLILTIPKGRYTPTFKPAAKTGPAELQIDAAAPWYSRSAYAWAVSGVLAIACAIFAYAFWTRGTPAVTGVNSNPPWPLSQVFDARHQTIIVVADGNYGMFRILTGQPGSLDQYLRREFLQSTNKTTTADSRLTEYISSSTLTSFADVADVAALLAMAGPFQKRVSIRYPRDLGMRDLDHDNYVFIGSPASNPWVSLYQGRLNFRESEGAVGNSAKAFVNTNPLPDEKPRYEGLRWTGTMGEDYATIALLPNTTHDGTVLILQGLQQEGTEAAGRFLADAEGRRQLKAALGISPTLDIVSENIWFEALIRSRTVAGAPNSTTLVAVRRIH